MAYGTIYVLVDSREPQNYRYVGRTVTKLSRRLYGHVYDAKIIGSTTNQKWINSVKVSGGTISIIEIDTADSESSLYFLERMWIVTLREAGYQLNNTAKGGKGGSWRPKGWKMTDEHRAAISIAHGGNGIVGLNKRRSATDEEWRRLAGDSRRGKKYTAEQSARQSKSQKARFAKNPQSREHQVGAARASASYRVSCRVCMKEFAVTGYATHKKIHPA